MIDQTSIATGLVLIIILLAVLFGPPLDNHTTITVGLVLLIIALVGVLGPALDDHSAEFDQAANIEDAQQAAAAERTYRAAVQRLCGPNSAWMELQDGAIQCTDKRGRPTTRVTLTAQVRP